jgi:hypothetical protein
MCTASGTLTRERRRFRKLESTELSLARTGSRRHEGSGESCMGQ